MNSSRSFFCNSIEAEIHFFDSSRPVCDELFGHLRGALFVELPRALGTAGFDHHDRDVAVVELTAGHDDLERGVVTLLERGVRDPLTVVVREAHRTDRAVERDTRDGQRGRRAVDRRDVVRVLEVDTEDGRDDLDLVAEVRRERRAQRPVGQAAREDGELAGATFTAEERTGDLARGVRALFDVDGEREEVDAVTRLRRGDGRQKCRTADFDDDCAGRKGCELAGLERHFETCGVDRTGNRNCVTHAKVPLCLARGTGSQLSTSGRISYGDPGRWRLTTDICSRGLYVKRGADDRSSCESLIDGCRAWR